MLRVNVSTEMKTFVSNRYNIIIIGLKIVFYFKYIIYIYCYTVNLIQCFQVIRIRLLCVGVSITSTLYGSKLYIYMINTPLYLWFSRTLYIYLMQYIFVKCATSLQRCASACDFFFNQLAETYCRNLQCSPHGMRFYFLAQV